MVSNSPILDRIRKGVNTMEWFMKLKTLDRRVIYLLIFLGVIIPLLKPMGFPIVVTEESQMLYDKIQALPEGAMIVLSFDYDPASSAEVSPMVEAVVHHCFKKNHKLICPSLWPQGPSLATEIFNKLGPRYDKTYGEDWVNLGYLPGAQTGLPQVETLAASFKTAYPRDIKDTPIDDIPIMKNVKKLSDAEMVIAFTSGDPGLLGWIQVAKDVYNIPVSGGGTAVNAPQFYPYIQSNQITGFLGGLKGAAEYEKLVGEPGLGTSGMDAQSIAHLVIILFIILSNIFVLLEKKDGRLGGAY